MLRSSPVVAYTRELYLFRALPRTIESRESSIEVGEGEIVCVQGKRGRGRTAYTSSVAVQNNEAFSSLVFRRAKLVQKTPKYLTHIDHSDTKRGIPPPP